MKPLPSSSSAPLGPRQPTNHSAAAKSANGHAAKPYDQTDDEDDGWLGNEPLRTGSVPAGTASAPSPRRAAAQSNGRASTKPTAPPSGTSSAKAESAEAKPTPEPTPDEIAALRAQAANYLDRFVPAGYLEATIGETIKIDPVPYIFLELMEKVLKEGGSPVDPIEKMSITLTTLAFHKSGQLLAKAAKADSLPAIAIYNAAAGKMMGEFRRQSLALQQYRAMAAAPKLKVVGGQPDEAPAKAKKTA